MENILQLREIRFSYNGKQVLAVPELAIPRAGIIGLAGPNGSGKSTLLKLLSCIEKPDAGTVYFQGSVALPEVNSIRRTLCLLPQQTYLLRRTVFENIAYGLKIRQWKEDPSAAVHHALELVGLGRSFTDRQWNELSGGEAQRVALAARLVLKPDCLLLDEPTASVDMESARCMRRAVLAARKEWGTTLVIASHHRSWLNDICDRIIYLYNGRILDCCYENILTGPWEKAGETLVACTLSDGQRVYVAAQDQSGISAVVAPEAFRIDRKQSGKDEKRLQGTIVSVTLDSKAGGPQVCITCGDQRFMVDISSDSLESERCIPGREVSLFYNPSDITWLG